FFFFSSRRRHTRSKRDWSSDVCSSDLAIMTEEKNIMETLYEKLDENSKKLHDENGQSYIENLGLAMEDIYTNQRDLLEQSTIQEIGRASCRERVKIWKSSE